MKWNWKKAKSDKIGVNKVSEPLILDLSGADLFTNEDVLLLSREQRKYKSNWWINYIEPKGYKKTKKESCLAAYINGSDGCGIGPTKNKRLTYYAVRPALTINTIKGSYKIGDRFRIKDYEFEIISHNKAWLYRQDIGYSIFDNNFKDYEHSDIKKMIDNWYKELIKEN
jgi:hypothetical protein